MSCAKSSPSGGTVLDRPLEAPPAVGCGALLVPPVLVVGVDRPLEPPPAVACDALVVPPVLAVGLSRPVLVLGLDRPLEQPPAPTLAKLVNESSSLARASPNDVALAPGPHRALSWFTAHDPLEEILASSLAFSALSPQNPA